MVQTDAIAEIYNLQVLDENVNSGTLMAVQTDMEPELALLLQTYGSVFYTPHTLTPHRSHDHAIPLLEGSSPVKVKPYRYPHSKKEEIEKLVEGMLKDGIIQHSKSPFSSPIILVKKKDGSWRVCTDYRALNAITIKDSFPIPTVDELIDEIFVMSFGLTNAPASFQSLMNNIFQGLLRRFVFGFGVTQIDYLGHTLSGSGVAMDDSKLVAVRAWPQPSNLKQLRGFLGLIGYYRRFVKQYASIVAPLTELLKKDGFHWTEKATAAFEQLKLAMTFAPILAIPNFKEPFVLETDASGMVVGVVLSQNQHPIAYFSKKMSHRMQKQSAYVRELYAVTETLAKFRHYLLGHHFWLPKFLRYDFEIQYKAGKDNIPTDALSRSFFMAWSEPQCIWLQQLVELTKTYLKLSNLYSQCIQGQGPNSEYSVKDGILFWKGRILVPNNSTLINQILQEFHNSKIGGHAAKVDHTLPKGILQLLPIPQQVWEDIAMDFITHLSAVTGYTTIMVVIDRLSKFSYFIPLKSDFSNKSVAEAFIAQVVKIHGIPKSIISDRDRVFISSFWQHLFKSQGTTLAMGSAYHPQSDGQMENLNKTLEMYLRCYVYENPKS
ncbi:hypothetical protein V8G54_036400 [Vigna mungo]|uniref:Integrase catalytic domain-containing protein n=1 Tax=Vigna mungo TaxID=3915 RepID=A0AAQ3MGN8_VIGMU